MYNSTNNDHIVKLQTKSAANVSLLTTTKLPKSKRAANVVIHTHVYFYICLSAKKVHKWGVQFLTVNKIRFKHFVLLLLCVCVHNWSVSQ